MNAIITTVLPVFGLIVVGYILAKANIIQAEEEEPELLAVQDETQEMLLVA